jgi:hypothetical protein
LFSSISLQQNAGVILPVYHLDEHRHLALIFNYFLRAFFDEFINKKSKMLFHLSPLNPLPPGEGKIGFIQDHYYLTKE